MKGPSRKWKALSAVCYDMTHSIHTAIKPGRFLKMGESTPNLFLWSNDKDLNSWYFTDCFIQGEKLHGYNDTDCVAVTVRESNVKSFFLFRKSTLVRLRS